jgi:cytochrome c553
MEDNAMNKPLIILSAVALGISMTTHAKGSYEAGKAKAEACAACHGHAGTSTVPGFPKLGGQHRDYLYHALKDYKLGKRKNPVMAGQVQDLSDADMEDLAVYFSKQRGLNVKY